MFSNVQIPYGAYWSSPFARWQGSLAHLHSILLAAHVAKDALEKRDIAPENFDHAVMGTTTPQMSSFHGAPWLMTEIGAPEVGGPTMYIPIFVMAKYAESPTWKPLSTFHISKKKKTEAAIMAMQPTKNVKLVADSK